VKVAINDRRGGGVNKRALRKSCLRVLKAEEVRRDAVLSLTVLSEDGIGELNRKYLSREGPTDVIAFPMGEECESGFLLGDVLVCPEFIDRNKGRYDVEEGRELEFVAAHGVLHLLGYEDGDEEGWLKMDRRQREILGLPEGRER